MLDNIRTCTRAKKCLSAWVRNVGSPLFDEHIPALLIQPDKRVIAAVYRLSQCIIAALTSFSEDSSPRRCSSCLRVAPRRIASASALLLPATA